MLKQSWPQEGRAATPVIVELLVVDDAEVDVGRLVVVVGGVVDEPLDAVTEDNEVDEEI